MSRDLCYFLEHKCTRGVEKVTFAAFEEATSFRLVISNVLRCSTWSQRALEKQPKSSERIYKTPGHPSKKRLFSSQVDCGWMPCFLICQPQCVDVFWQCCLWLMGSSVEYILLSHCWSDGDKGDNLADRRCGFRLVIFPPGTLWCVQ